LGVFGRKMNKAKKATERVSIVQIALSGALALSWLVMVLAASSRMYFVRNYEVGEMLEPFWEPFAATSIVVLFSFVVLCGWLLCLWMSHQVSCVSQRKAILFFAISLLPLLFWVLRVTGEVSWPPQFWETLWIAAWTGLSFGELARRNVDLAPRSIRKPPAVVGWAAYLVLPILCLLFGGWWYSQSVVYHQNFLLGFNDFGHFLQRVANTAEGRGLLLESPVLPMFWDHFNPGLLLVVPLWKVYPSVNLVFALQAGSLAVGSLLIYSIARRLGHAQLTAVTFGIAWLVQPAVGQMNLAYTYGWHPITFAIPLLLAAILCLLAKQRLAALGCVLLALSMEESAFVIVALVAAVCAAIPLIDRRLSKKNERENEVSDSVGLISMLSTPVWFTVAMTSALGFVLVYKFSGLAEFQTGRFVALGNTPLAILLSPLIRPGAFWGQVLKSENFVFVALLWLPCGLPALLRGWRYLLPTFVPLGVLCVWDHVPAHCIAFQYPSTLLPVFWLASLSGSALPSAESKSNSALPSAVTALMTGLVLSLFVGQLPFSSVTLLDVEAMTYGANSEMRRKSDAEDGQWLLQQVAEIRKSGDECLATGRIAAHLVGIRDIETVGQYLERRERLAALPDRQGAPIKHYRWIILDREELVKWSGSQTAAVETEARENGFELVEDRFGVVIFKRPEPK
jgi:uncharacterized membrane protein